MPRIQRFQDLEAWKIAREVTREIYAVAQRREFARDFGLRDQVCRSSVSIMSNIAEGFERDGDKEFVNFLSIAKGSAGETRSLLYVALDQKYISTSEFDFIMSRLIENSRVISGLSSYLRQSELKGLKFR
ncbi:MAG TPA: four helix bundle protein [Pyrinomonadaceae bacterium]|nr:four helix bundle protein [Pyrinomonadaceae bacterium]